MFVLGCSDRSLLVGARLACGVSVTIVRNVLLLGILLVEVRDVHVCGIWASLARVGVLKSVVQILGLAEGART